MREQIDWKQELLDSANFNGKQEKILKHGPKSLTDSWILGALFTKWKKLKGIREKNLYLIAGAVSKSGIRMLRMLKNASLDNWLECV